MEKFKELFESMDNDEKLYRKDIDTLFIIAGLPIPRSFWKDINSKSGDKFGTPWLPYGKNHTESEIEEGLFKIKVSLSKIATQIVVKNNRDRKRYSVSWIANLNK